MFGKNNQMKKVGFLLSLLFLLIAGVGCKEREVSENFTSLGSYKVGNTEVKIHKGSLHFVKSSMPDEENRAVFIFESHADEKNRKVGISVSYPYNMEGIDGEYLIGGSPRAMDSWNTYYFEKVGNTQHMYREPTNGVCTITKHSESQYTVSFRFLPKNGEWVQGNFSGTVIQ